MPLIREKQSIGLDLGQSSAKMVQVALRGKAVQIVRSATFDARKEGLLDEAEMYAGTASWLKELGLLDREVCIGLLQHLATTQVSDFPPKASGDELQGMVSFETVQLAGLSDEAFASDYHVMAPEYGRKNPVLIGICRQAVIDERNRAFVEVGIRVSEVAMEGMAAANALFFLHPEAFAEKAPQLILDIGAESSTLLIVAGGQVLFVGALLFGADKFTKALAALADGSGGAPAANGRLDLSQFDSPLIGVNRQLEAEIRNSIEHWRAGERPEISGKAFTKVWVCGGGAKLEGLAASLGRSYGCLGEAFGPPGPGGVPDPQLAVALGLALQGLGTAAIAISLCPEVIRWTRIRKQRFGYVLAAVIILFSLTVIYMVKYSNDLKRREQDFAAQTANLEKCRDLIPKLEEHSQLIRHHEKMLLPVIEKANRGGRFLKTIEVLAAAQAENDWFVYLADELSFEEGRPKDEKAGAAPAPERIAAPKGPAFPGAVSVLDNPEASMPQLQVTLVTGIEQIRSMVMCGYSPKAGRDFLEPVKAIRARLNESALFENVDSLPKPERIGRDETIFQPWAAYLQGLAERRITGLFVPYMFRLPFAELDINKPVVAPASAKPAAKPPKPAPVATDNSDE
jgi:Tfp pilus assembly PilM family ATPase/cell division protein FtsB